MDAESIGRAADLLVDVRRSRRRLTDLPPDLQPSDIAAAYAVQDAVVARAGTIGGWKVSPPTPVEEPRCSPVLAADIHASPANLTFAANLIAPEIEVEIALLLARDLPARARAFDAEEVAEAIGSAHPALEILSSRFENRKAVPPNAAVADGQSSGGIVFGPALTDWRSLDFANVAMELYYDDERVGHCAGGPTLAVVLEEMTWLANHAARRNGGLKSGQIVITGARIKPIPIPRPNSRVRAEVAGLGSVSAKFD